MFAGDAIGFHRDPPAGAIGGMKSRTFLEEFGFFFGRYGLSLVFGEWARPDLRSGPDEVGRGVWPKDVEMSLEFSRQF